jgi:hypothetical protein
MVNKSFHKSSASCAVIRLQDFSAASTTNIHLLNQATISFLIGKLYGFHTSHIGKIDITAQEFSTILLNNFIFDIG